MLSDTRRVPSTRLLILYPTGVSPAASKRMRSFRLRRFAGNARSIAIAAAFSLDPFSVQYRMPLRQTEMQFQGEGLGISYDLNWALAGRGIMIEDKAFHNLKASDLPLKGATIAERLHGLPVYVKRECLWRDSRYFKSPFQ